MSEPMFSSRATMRTWGSGDFDTSVAAMRAGMRAAARANQTRVGSQGTGQGGRLRGPARSALAQPALFLHPERAHARPPYPRRRVEPIPQSVTTEGSSRHSDPSRHTDRQETAHG